MSTYDVKAARALLNKSTPPETTISSVVDSARWALLKEMRDLGRGTAFNTFSAGKFSTNLDDAVAFQNAQNPERPVLVRVRPYKTEMSDMIMEVWELNSHSDEAMKTAALKYNPRQRKLLTVLGKDALEHAVTLVVSYLNSRKP